MLQKKRCPRRIKSARTRGRAAPRSRILGVASFSLGLYERAGGPGREDPAAPRACARAENLSTTRRVLRPLHAGGAARRAQRATPHGQKDSILSRRAALLVPGPPLEPRAG